jgi:hypothetical protein
MPNCWPTLPERLTKNFCYGTSIWRRRTAS